MELTKDYLRQANQDYQRRALLLKQARNDHQKSQEDFHKFAVAYKENLKKSEQSMKYLIAELESLSDRLQAL